MPTPAFGSAGTVSEAPSLDGQPHCRRHCNRIAGERDRRIHQHAGGLEQRHVCERGVLQAAGDVGERIADRSPPLQARPLRGNRLEWLMVFPPGTGSVEHPCIGRDRRREAFADDRSRRRPGSGILANSP